MTEKHVLINDTLACILSQPQTEVIFITKKVVQNNNKQCTTYYKLHEERNYSYPGWLWSWKMKKYTYMKLVLVQNPYTYKLFHPSSMSTVIRNYFLLAFWMATACKAQLAWNVEMFLLHVSFIHLFLFLFCYWR